MRKQQKGTIEYRTPYHWEARGVSRQIQIRRARFAQKYIKASDHVLDIGCGDGFLTNAISAFCQRVIGIDNSLTGISLARDRVDNAKVALLISSASNLPFKDDTFDIITLFEVIEHIPAESVKNTVEEIKRVLKDGGKIIVTTPNSRNLQNIICRRRMVSTKHEKEYSQAELLRLLSDFEKIELSGIYLPLFPFTLLSKPRYRFIWQILFFLARYFPKFDRFITYCGRKK